MARTQAGTAGVKRSPRPNLSRAIRLLIRDISGKVPEFGHVRAERILVVAGEARRSSRATIRPLTCQDSGRDRALSGERRKPRVTFRGRSILYILTLRPLFFRRSTPEQRVETVMHELFHLSDRFDGTLEPSRRHRNLGKEAFERALRPLVKRYLAACSDEALARLAFNGEVLVRQWLERPPGRYKPGRRQRRTYSESHTFLGPVRMLTRPTRH